MKFLAVVFTLFLSQTLVTAQNTFVVYGRVSDIRDKPVEDVSILDDSNRVLATTNKYGYYELKLLVGKSHILTFSAIGTAPETRLVESAAAGSRVELNLRYDVSIKLMEVDIRDENQKKRLVFIPLDPKTLDRFPNPSRDISTFIRTLPGVSVNNELSSQYSVRGGNYDENLIYVNDIEIYRPFLVRTGQQEGLSFPNLAMIDNLRFSAGGFESRYGDKMSSVLDITYKEPHEFIASADVSLLGADISAGGGNERFTVVGGARYKSNQYLLNTLDVQGDYKPRFMDAQVYMTYSFTEKLSLGYLSHFSQNRFLLQPQSQETRFGTVTNAIQLYVGFGGQEIMQYNTFTNAIMLKYEPDRHTWLKFTASAYTSNEREFYDVEGAYRLDQLDNQFGSKTFGQAKYSLGYGYFINHARNELQAFVYNAAHRGYKKVKRSEWEWGLQYQHEYIDDRLREWKYNDSAGMSLSLQDTSVNVIILDGFTAASNILESNRYTAYLQNTYTLDRQRGLVVNAGLRTNYWDYNDVNVLSPRVQLLFEPNRKRNNIKTDSLLKAGIIPQDSLLKRDIKLKLAFGYYYQPPFYRELRNIQGQLNPNIQPQRSIHFVAGGDMNFRMGGRKFKLFSEAYFKKLDNMIPYLMDNIRVRYDAVNSSKGYAAGIDTRINGEFLKDLESWFTLSLMQTKENITYTDEKGQLKQSGYIRRPTDQRVNFSISFQDKLTSNPDNKVQVIILFGSGLPYYLGGKYRYTEGFTIPAYKRVDIGFSRDIIKPDGPHNTRFSKAFRSLALSLEIFNLFDINNTVSYIWLKDVQNNIYGVPNYLTGRRINLHIMAKF